MEDLITNQSLSRTRLFQEVVTAKGFLDDFRGNLENIPLTLKDISNTYYMARKQISEVEASLQQGNFFTRSRYLTQANQDFAKYLVLRRDLTQMMRANVDVESTIQVEELVV